MRRFARAMVFVCLTGMGHAVAHAQDSLLGTYTGSYVFPSRSGDTLLGVKLVVTSVADGVVKGHVELNTRGPCTGDYPMEGKYEENKLAMRSTAKGGRAGDCSFRFNVAVEGNKLVGTTGGGRPLQLSK